MVISHLLDSIKEETPAETQAIVEKVIDLIEEITIEPVVPIEAEIEELRFELKMEEEVVFPLDTHIEFESEEEEIKMRVQDVITSEPAENASINDEIKFDLNMDVEEEDVVAISNEEQELRIEQHIQRIKELKNLNVTINSPGGIRDLEKEPAYKRRNKKLNEVPHSSESQLSRLTLFEDGTNKTGIRTNNSFLHDNVD
jgi:cell division protein FtsZ